MKKLFAAFTIVAVAMVGVVVSPSKSDALPNFARQMSLPCFSCHFQHIPKLNAFGRSFKLGGYTDAAIDLLEDDGLSIPAVMPIGFIYKLRYQTTSTSDTTGDAAGTDRGEWQIPDEAAIWLAGRGGENVGYAVEWPGGWASGKVVIMLAQGDVKAGLSVYSTDALGAAFGMELSNTGVLRSVRMFEHRKETSIANKQGWGAGAAQGLTFFAGSSDFFAGLGLWAPVFEHADGALDLSTWARLAWTPTLGGFDALIGVTSINGSTKCNHCAEVGNEDGIVKEVATQALGVDVQLQGELAGMPTELQFMYGAVPSASDSADINLYTESTGFSFAGEVSLSSAIGVALGYSTYTDKSGSADVDTTAVTIGVPINLSQNTTLRPEYTSYSGDGKSHDSLVTIMLMGGF